MAAVMINRKRPRVFLNFNQQSTDPFGYSPPFKKLRFSFDISEDSGELTSISNSTISSTITINRKRTEEFLQSNGVFLYSPAYKRLTFSFDISEDSGKLNSSWISDDEDPLVDTVTIKRKRTEEALQSTSLFRYSPASKKSRFSFGMSEDCGEATLNLNPTISRISMYPDVKAPIKRQIHAPSRGILRNGLKSNGYCDKDDIDWDNFFVRKYDDAKNTTFTDTSKEVSDLVDDDEPVMEEISGDSSIEEVEVVEYDDAKRTTLLDDFRYTKEVIDLGDDERVMEANSEDSTIEEVEFFDCDKEIMVDCDDAKRTTSFNTLRYPKVVIDLVDDKPLNEAISEDSSFEEVEVVDCDKENNLRVYDSSTVPDSSIEFYLELLQSAEMQNLVTEALSLDIDLYEKKMSLQQQSHTKPVETLIEVPRELLIPVTKEEKAEVRSALSKGNRRKVLASHENSKIDITGEILQCLAPFSWLNDEVVNVYLELLKERETREPKKYLKCHFFNTFFYSKLVSGASGYNYDAVRRWTSKRKQGYDLIDCDMIFVPINMDSHWTLGIINNRDCKFMYLDSLNRFDPMVLNVLAKYMGDEAKEKSRKNIDVSSWGMASVKDLPQQHNGYDCGMFMLKYIDFLSRGLRLCFNQGHISYFRLRTAKEILRLRAD